MNITAIKKIKDDTGHVCNPCLGNTCGLCDRIKRDAIHFDSNGDIITFYHQLNGTGQNYHQKVNNLDELEKETVMARVKMIERMKRDSRNIIEEEKDRGNRGDRVIESGTAEMARNRMIERMKQESREYGHELFQSK